jgi:branched-subunit amino acid ABC-type transport system permease component
MYFLEFIVDGLLIGFVYGIAAMGLSLIWGVMKVINLSHGAIMALGMFGIYLSFNSLGLNPYIALLLVAVGGLLMGIAVYGLAVHRVINAPYLSTLLATFAVNMIIIGIGTAVFTNSTRNVDFTLGSLSLGTITLTWSRIAAAMVALLVAAALYLFLNRTRTGKSIRAVANNRAAAELMGIPSSGVLALSFGIGTLLAATAGGLIATIFPFDILAGSTYQVRGFVICVLGGLGNPVGALVGGLILGALEGVIPFFIAPSWVPVLEFILFVLILLVRPSGLFGREQT